jgi:hypothetical protein
VIQAILHGASAAVHRSEITTDHAPTFVRDTVLTDPPDRNPTPLGRQVNITSSRDDSSGRPVV